MSVRIRNGITVDRFEKAFYHLSFRLAFVEKKGAEFQNWFAKLASYAFGADFEAVRAYGNRGDLKCDGRLVSTGTIFQCYAPDRMDQTRLNAKIDGDFRGAYTHWGRTMAEWILVHNDGRGLPPQTVQLLDELRKSHPEIKIQVWTEAQLLRFADGLSLTELQAWVGVQGVRLRRWRSFPISSRAATSSRIRRLRRDSADEAHPS